MPRWPCCHRLARSIRTTGSNSPTVTGSPQKRRPPLVEQIVGIVTRPQPRPVYIVGTFDVVAWPPTLQAAGSVQPWHITALVALTASPARLVGVGLDHLVHQVLADLREQIEATSEKDTLMAMLLLMIGDDDAGK